MFPPIEALMDNLRGIFLMVVAMVAFAVEDALIKAGTSVMPTSQLILTVGVMGTGLLLLACRAQGLRLLTLDLAHPAVIARNVTDTVGVVFFVTALAVVPLTTLAALIQLTPLSITLCAALLLGETVGWRRWSAVIAGFIGMLLIIRPGMESFNLATLLGVGAVACLTGRDLATRFVP
ncbi:MAG: DMT family transporter, partial [Paracoccaceae bacterium]